MVYVGVERFKNTMPNSVADFQCYYKEWYFSYKVAQIISKPSTDRIAPLSYFPFKSVSFNAVIVYKFRFIFDI